MPDKQPLLDFVKELAGYADEDKVNYDSERSCGNGDDQFSDGQDQAYARIGLNAKKLLSELYD